VHTYTAIVKTEQDHPLTEAQRHVQNNCSMFPGDVPIIREVKLDYMSNMFPTASVIVKFDSEYDLTRKLNEWLTSPGLNEPTLYGLPVGALVYYTRRPA